MKKATSLTYLSLTRDMASDIFPAITGNVSTYFHPFLTLEECSMWTLQALIDISAGDKIEIAVYDPQSRFVGLASLRDLKTPRPEFGLWVREDAQGKGYGKEAVSWLIDWARKNTGAQELLYEADTKNATSVRLADGLGFRFEVDYQDGDVAYRRYVLAI